MPGKNGGGFVTSAETIAVVHVHYVSLGGPPHRADDSSACEGLRSYVISGTGAYVWEVGRLDGGAAIRLINSDGNPGRWERYNENAAAYRIYNPRVYPND